MKKLFLIDIQSVSDVITNSSSELFIIDNKNSKEEVIELLNSVYPDWRTEYEEPVPFSEIDDNELWYIIPCNNIYNIQYEASDACKVRVEKKFYYDEKRLKDFNKKLNTTKYNTDIAKFAKDYGLEPEVFWDGFKELKVSLYYDSSNYPYLSCNMIELSEEGRQAIIKSRPNAWLLRSINDNPDWDRQEDLMQIAERIHLG